MLSFSVRVKYNNNDNTGLYISAAFDNRAGELEAYLKEKVQTIKYDSIMIFIFFVTLITL